MSRITTLTLAGIAATAVTVVGTVPAAQAAPLPAMTGDAVGGAKTTVDHVGWRRGYHGGGYYGPRYGYGYGYRRRNVGGALFAGAALGLIGGAIAASAAPRYRYYDYGYARPVYYGGYGGYGYRPAYGYGYGYPAYGGYYGW